MGKIDLTDVLENLEEKIYAVETPDQAAELIAGECMRACLDPTRHDNPNLHVLEIYDNDIGRIVSPPMIYSLKWQAANCSTLNRQTQKQSALGHSQIRSPTSETAGSIRMITTFSTSLRRSSC